MCLFSCIFSSSMSLSLSFPRLLPPFKLLAYTYRQYYSKRNITNHTIRYTYSNQNKVMLLFAFYCFISFCTVPHSYSVSPLCIAKSNRTTTSNWKAKDRTSQWCRKINGLYDFPYFYLFISLFSCFPCYLFDWCSAGECDIYQQKIMRTDSFVSRWYTTDIHIPACVFLSCFVSLFSLLALYDIK